MDIGSHYYHGNCTMNIFADFWFMNNVYTIVIPVCAYISYKWGFEAGVNQILDEFEEKGIIQIEEGEQ